MDYTDGFGVGHASHPGYNFVDNSIALNQTDLQDFHIFIEHCGRNRKFTVQRLLFSVQEILRPALDDVRNGTDSKFGFKAMFKDDAVTSTVWLLLKHIVTFAKASGLQRLPSVPSRPRFACVDQQSLQDYEHLQLGYDPLQKCYSTLSRGKEAHVFYASGTQYIFICPSFFNIKVEPEKEPCPKIRDNKFTGSEVEFHDEYQTFNLIYALARFHLGANALDAESDPREVFDWNECVFNLNAVESVMNPTNTELYIASKYFSDAVSVDTD